MYKKIVLSVLSGDVAAYYARLKTFKGLLSRIVKERRETTSPARRHELNLQFDNATAAFHALSSEYKKRSIRAATLLIAMIRNKRYPENNPRHELPIQEMARRCLELGLFAYQPYNNLASIRRMIEIWASPNRPRFSEVISVSDKLTSFRPVVRVAVEGIDGSGKSTLVAALVESLAKRSDISVFRRTEPSHTTEYGQIIRYLASQGKRLPLDLEITAFLKDRLILQREERDRIAALQTNKSTVIVSDRSLWSSFAYQADSEISMLGIVKDHRTKKVHFPDVVVHLIISPEEAMKRISLRNGSEELIDPFEGIDKLSKIAERYSVAFSTVPIPYDHVYIQEDVTARSADEIAKSVLDKLELIL